MKKRFILYLLTLSLVLAAFPFPAGATEPVGETGEPTEETTEATEVVRAPDQCGEDMTWSYEEGTLTITGTGAMDDYEGAAPWDTYRKEITTVVFEGKVSYIGARAFLDYDSLVAVDFGECLYEIGTEAFHSCDGLTVLSLPATFKIFGEESFSGCKNLKEIHCSGRFPSFRQNCLWDTYATIYFPAENPWSVKNIADLEEAFKGRIEFLASDGSDPYEPTEAAEATEPEETTEPTEAATEPTEVTTQPTEAPTQPATEVTRPPEETTLPETEPEETTAPTQAVEEEETGKSGSWIGVVMVVIVLAVLGAGQLLFGKRRRGGKYSR